MINEYLPFYDDDSETLPLNMSEDVILFPDSILGVYSFSFTDKPLVDYDNLEVICH